MVRQKILILNGPNLNLLGTREPEIYGQQTFVQYLEVLRDKFEKEFEISYFQSNEEGAMINKLHEVGFSYDGILLNAGGYTHTSIAIHDAIKAITVPVIEVHLSNPHRRDAFRHKSFVGEAAVGTVSGFGAMSYTLALDAAVKL